MDSQKKFIKTAQFAKLCNVSKQTLLYYDKMGIFHPKYVDDKGYRYYSFTQHESFYVISMLRQLGTPLKEIKEYIQNRNVDTFLLLLDKKQEMITSKIENLSKMSLLIDKRRNMTLYGMREKNNEDVIIYPMPEERIIISEPIIKHDEKTYVNIISELERYIFQNNINTYSTGVTITKKSVLEKKHDKLEYFYVKTDTMCERTRIKPAGLYAITYHYGAYDTTYLAYYRLIKYIEDNGYEIVGKAYEDGLLDFCTQKDDSEYLSEISVMVSQEN